MGAGRRGKTSPELTRGEVSQISVDWPAWYSANASCASASSLPAWRIGFNLRVPEFAVIFGKPFAKFRQLLWRQLRHGLLGRFQCCIHSIILTGSCIILRPGRGGNSRTTFGSRGQGGPGSAALIAARGIGGKCRLNGHAVRKPLDCATPSGDDPRHDREKLGAAGNSRRNLRRLWVLVYVNMRLTGGRTPPHPGPLPEGTPHPTLSRRERGQAHRLFTTDNTMARKLLHRGGGPVFLPKWEACEVLRT